MSMTNGGPAMPPQQGPAPQINVLAQYIKDFSFENPNAPRSLAPSEQQPQITIQINVGLAQLAGTDYEVSLKLEGKAEAASEQPWAKDLYREFKPSAPRPFDLRLVPYHAWANRGRSEMTVWIPLGR